MPSPLSRRGNARVGVPVCVNALWRENRGERRKGNRHSETHPLAPPIKGGE